MPDEPQFLDPHEYEDDDVPFDSAERPPKENGSVHQPRLALPILSDAVASRWTGLEPPPLVMAWHNMPIGSTTLLVGDGGAGKSLLMQTLATYIAAGYTCYGQAVTEGRSVYLTAEDSDDDLHRRHQKIIASLPAELRDKAAERTIVKSLLDEDCGSTLWTADGGPTELLRDIERQLAEIKPVYVGLDTASLVFEGNENIRAEVSPFIRHLNRTARRIGCANNLSAHTSKSRSNEVGGRASGSTAWVFGSRCAYELRRGEEQDTATLDHFKGNYSGLSQPIDLEWTPEGLLKHKPPPDHRQVRASENKIAQIIVQECETQWGRGEPLATTRQSGERFLPTHIAKYHDIKARDVATVMDIMRRKGAILTQKKPGTRKDGIFIDRSACQREWLP